MERSGQTILQRYRAGVAYLLLAALVVWVVSPTRPAPASRTAHPAAAATDAAAIAQGRIPVHFWHMWSGEWLPVMNRAVAEFNASQSKYEVIALQVPPTDGDQKFLLGTAGGDPPDVMAQWTPAISAWAQAGILQPLETRMTPQEREFFLHQTYPIVHQSGWYKGHAYGMVMAFDAYACYWRPSQWRQAGLDADRFPATLEQLAADGAKLTQSDASGRIARLGFLPTTFTDYAGSFGGSFYDAASDQVRLDTPANRAAMDFIVREHQKLGFDRVVRFNSGLSSQDGANWPFITGQQAVVLDGEWRVHQLAQFAPGMDYRVSPLPPPAGPGGKPLASGAAVDYLTIPVGARHADGAWEFIKFLCGIDHPEQAAKYKTWFCWLPTSPQMAASPVYRQFLKENPQFATFVKVAASPNLVALPPVPYSVFLHDRILADDDLAERGVVSGQQALRLMDDQVAQELARRRELGYAE